MDSRAKDYGLDLHCTMILEEYREFLPSFRRVLEIVLSELQRIIG